MSVIPGFGNAGGNPEFSPSSSREGNPSSSFGSRGRAQLTQGKSQGFPAANSPIPLWIPDPRDVAQLKIPHPGCGNKFIKKGGKGWVVGLEWPDEEFGVSPTHLAIPGSRRCQGNAAEALPKDLAAASLERATRECGRGWDRRELHLSILGVSPERGSLGSSQKKPPKPAAG